MTKWIFVEKIDGNNVYCKCGCLSSDGTSRLKYAASTSGHADRHAKTNHGALYAEFLRCQNNQGNFNSLIETISELNDAALEKIRKKRRVSDHFFAKSIKLEAKTASDLRLVIWEIANGISRNAANDSLFDSYIRSLGANVVPNRHEQQEKFVPFLDSYVVKEMKQIVVGVPAVSLSSDG